MLAKGLYQVQTNWSSKYRLFRCVGNTGFDIRNHCWSKRILEIFDISEHIFPLYIDTCSKVGQVSKIAADTIGLSSKTLVINGGGDQIMQGIGSGATKIGAVTTNIGSSGQVCFQIDTPIVNPKLSTNVFCGYKTIVG